MEKNRFAQKLTAAIDSCGITKNEVIRRTKIDRSSFFGILGGRRRPTQDQIAVILEAADIRGDARREILDEYIRSGIGEAAWNSRTGVRRILRLLAEMTADTEPQSSNPQPAPSGANGSIPQPAPSGADGSTAPAPTAVADGGGAAATDGSVTSVAADGSVASAAAADGGIAPAAGMAGSEASKTEPAGTQSPQALSDDGSKDGSGREGVRAIYGAFHVYREIARFLGRVLAEAGAWLDFQVPLTEQKFYEVLRTGMMLAEGKGIQVRQILRFPADSGEESAALGCLEQVLWFILSEDWDYAGYYIRSADDGTGGTGELFPGWLIAGREALLIEAGMGSALLLTGDGAAALLRARFEKMLQNAGVLESAVTYTDMLRQVSSPGKKYALQSIPCTATIANAEQVDKYLSGPVRQSPEFMAMASMLWQHCSRLQAENALTVFTSWGGIEALARTGVIEELPPGILEPISEEDRRLVLENYKKTAGKKLFVINESRLPLSGKWLVLVVENRAVYIYPRIARMNDRVIRITQKSIVEAFTSYMESCGMTEDVWSKPKLIAALDALLGDGAE